MIHTLQTIKQASTVNHKVATLFATRTADSADLQLLRLPGYCVWMKMVCCRLLWCFAVDAVLSFSLLFLFLVWLLQLRRALTMNAGNENIVFYVLATQVHEPCSSSSVWRPVHDDADDVADDASVRAFESAGVMDSVGTRRFRWYGMVWSSCYICAGPNEEWQIVLNMGLQRVWIIVRQGTCRSSEWYHHHYPPAMRLWLFNTLGVWLRFRLDAPNLMGDLTLIRTFIVRIIAHPVLNGLLPA